MDNFDETFIKDYCDDNFAEYLSDMLVRLKKSNPEYESLLKKQSNLMNKNDRLADVLENHCLFSLSKYEVKILKNYLSLKEDSREIEEKEIPAKGHNYIKLEEESREATCTEAGKIVGKCECGEYEEKDIPATGHDFQGGKCTKCDAEEPEHQHNFVRIESESAKATCTKDGKIVSKCECEEYEVEIIPATGHNYDENGKCVNCDAEDPDYEGKKGEEVEGSDTSQDNNQPPADTTTTERIVQNSNSRRRR